MSRRDPTGTTRLRRQYGAQFYKRFRRLKGLIWQGVGVEDRLSLGAQSSGLGVHDDDDDGVPNPENNPDPTDLGGPEIDPDQIPEGIHPPHIEPGSEAAYEFFMEWYVNTQTQIVFGPQDQGESWSDKYIRRTYEKGVDDASERMREAGIELAEETIIRPSLNVPIHTRTVNTLLRRNFDAMEGVTDATRKEVGRVLANGLVRGENPKDMAREINDRIDKIGVTRARTHARTMTIESYNEATLNRYEQIMGDDGRVEIKAEWLTAGDDRVCEECASKGSEILTVKEARGMIPFHPNCRCTWSPVTQGTRESRLPTPVRG